MLKDNIHWLSYTRHEGPNGTGMCVFPATGCMVSIVLDDDARYHFSAIRLLIVCLKSKKLDHLNIDDCPNLGRHLFVTDRTGSSTKYRTCLSRRRAAYQSSRHIGSSAAPTSGLPICNIVFQLVDTGKLFGIRGGPPIVTLSPLRYFQFPPSFLPVRVAYDRVHRVDPNNPSLLAFLNINTYFDRLPPNFLNRSELPSAIPAHSIRILPKSGRPQSQSGTLPPHIICHIVDFAIGRKPIGWRPALLAYSLVCKSWAHVLDLFFGRFDGSFEERTVEVLNVARSLKARPERGALMRTLDTRDYKKERSDNAKDTPTFHSGLDGWHGFLKIIQCATSARVVHLQAIPRSFTAEVVYKLSNLREVRRCSLHDNKNSLTMADIQNFIADWVHLDRLEVSHWAREHDAQQSTDHLACNIEALFLLDGVISGRQLLRFVASPTPQLERLNLHQVHGVSNHDFRSFLTIAAPTLRHVSIAESPMPCSHPDEELAVDAVMPGMKVLEHLAVPGTHASALAIARKVAVAQTLSSITIHPADPKMALGQVAEALEVTGWKGVLLRWGEAPLEWDEALKTRALNAAKERGVVFHCWAG